MFAQIVKYVIVRSAICYTGPYRLTVRTHAFQAWNRSSILREVIAFIIMKKSISAGGLS